MEGSLLQSLLHERKVFAILAVERPKSALESFAVCSITYLFIGFLLLTLAVLYPGSLSARARSITSAGTDVHTAAKKGEVSEKLIIDTDMGLDDARAILAILVSGKDRILCFTTVEGSASIGKACDNLIGLLETMNIENIPIYRGFRGIKSPPPWRKTSNSLASTPFPPPHEIEVKPHTLDNLHKIVTRSGQGLMYISLGPLTNLAKLEAAYPGILFSIKRIVLPAEVGKNGRQASIASWNLLADESSAEKVFGSSKDILIVDLSCKEKLSAEKLLEELSSPSPQSKWIRKNLKALKKNRKHIFLYDELLASAVLDESALEISKKRYSLESRTNDSFILRENPEGNIQLAKIKSCKKASARLKALWEKQVPAHRHSLELTIPSRKLIKAFHGHLGPYVVLGFRASRLALSILGHEGHFGINARVFSTLKPPRSCFIDGVQLGSGCTLGKRNIELNASGSAPHVIFSTYEGDTVSVCLKSNIPSLIDSLIQIGGVEYAGDRMLRMNADSLFFVKRDPAD